MDKDKKRDTNPQIEKVGVAWRREFKGGRKGIKVSINKEIFILYENKKANKPTDPHYVVCKYLDKK